MSTDRVGIIGIGQSEFRSRRDDASYPELVREGVVRAMQDAGLDFDAIQAVVYSLSPDAMVGIGNAERLGVDAVGGRNKPFLRINNGGATGISAVTAAYYHVASGMFDVVLTAGADKIGECGDSQTVLNKIWDPSYERPLPLGTINMLAMSAVRYMQRYGMTEEDMARVTVKNRRHAALNPKAHLRTDRDDRRRAGIAHHLLADQAAGLLSAVIGRGGDGARVGTVHPGQSPGCGVDHRRRPFGGDLLDGRPHGQQSDGRTRRCLCAGPLVREILSDGRHHRPGAAGACRGTVRAVQQHRVPLDRCGTPGRRVTGESIARLRDGEFEIGGRIPVNPSGGTLCTNAIAVTAMARVAEVALQVWGRAGEHQVKGARLGIASGNGGDHQIFGTMVIEA